MENDNVEQQEIWRTVEEFPQYEISNFANIRHKENCKNRKFSIGKRGYPIVSFRKNGKQYVRTLHIIFARAFIPNPDNKPQINHKDGNKLNCSLSNLEWCTNKENMNHARMIGLHTSDGDKAVAQYKNDILIAIYKSASEASRVTKINRGNICSCARGVKCYKSAGGYQWKYVNLNI